MKNENTNQNSLILESRVLTDRELGLEEKKLDKEFRERVVGHLFSAVFLVFLLVAVLVFAGVGMLIWSNRDFKEVTEYWRWIVPLVTTYIGYAIGKVSGD